MGAPPSIVGQVYVCTVFCNVRNTTRYSTFPVSHNPFPFPVSLASPPSPLGSRPKSRLPSPSSQRLPASPRPQARFPRGIAFPPHVASPIRSDLSSPAKEWDRLVAGASPLDCLFVGIYYAGGFRARATGHGGRRVGIGFVLRCTPARERWRECESLIAVLVLSFYYRHGTAVWREFFFAPSKVNAAGSSAERGKERLMIGWVALNLFFPQFVRARAGAVQGAG